MSDRVDHRTTELWQYRDVDFARVAGDLGHLELTIIDPTHLGEALGTGLIAGTSVVIDVMTGPDVRRIRL